MEYNARKIFAKFCVQEVPDSMKRYVSYMIEGVLGAVLNCANMLAVYTKLSITHAATIVNVYSGLVGIMPIVMAFLLDNCLGTYWMLFLSSVTYSIGLSFLAMSIPPVLSKVTDTCSAYEPACIGHIQSILFYVALALIAVVINMDEMQRRSCHNSTISFDRGTPQRLRFVGARGEDETRVTLRIIPMWMTFIVCGIVISIGNTYFLEQANDMNNKLGSLHVPVVFLFLYYSMLKWGNDQSFENLMIKTSAAVLASSPIFYSIICCIIAALVEAKRLHVVKKYGLIDKPEDTIPMSMFWLLPQLFFLAFMEYSAGKIFVMFCVQEVPDSMKRYVPYMTEGVLGAGTIGSVLLVYIVNKVSKRGGRLSWFQDTLNRSRLDNYYWVLTVLSSINYVVNFFLLSWFKIRRIRPR
ncbi:hypothetical protein HHK36_022326 [Tetracentron sinense]|uniref:Uncharacterized protein n=1 Tax=Tetracentron sinense TaxID=13715 RepID=A0A834YUQ3_TETSI|nr:hypothetical protein HHK36_022326 [Tetracentron sinense]